MLDGAGSRRERAPSLGVNGNGEHDGPARSWAVGSVMVGRPLTEIALPGGRQMFQLFLKAIEFGGPGIGAQSIVNEAES